MFFLVPGPLTFTFFARGFSWGNLAWLAAGAGRNGCGRVRVGGCRAWNHEPYILRFDEDKPNPLYRRVCYTFAWNAVLSFALLNLERAGDRERRPVSWYMKQIYQYAYFPVCGAILRCWASPGALPRVGRWTKGEGTERRYFYGSVWAVTVAQTLLLALWQILPPTRAANVVKLVVFVGAMLLMGLAAYRGALPRTRPIVPGALVVAD